MLSNLFIHKEQVTELISECLISMLHLFENTVLSEEEQHSYSAIISFVIEKISQAIVDILKYHENPAEEIISSVSKLLLCLLEWIMYNKQLSLQDEKTKRLISEALSMAVSFESRNDSFSGRKKMEKRPVKKTPLRDAEAENSGDSDSIKDICDFIMLHLMDHFVNYPASKGKTFMNS